MYNTLHISVMLRGPCRIRNGILLVDVKDVNEDVNYRFCLKAHKMGVYVQEWDKQYRLKWDTRRDEFLSISMCHHEIPMACKKIKMFIDKQLMSHDTVYIQSHPEDLASLSMYFDYFLQTHEYFKNEKFKFH